jgi:hypothetical protein
MSDRNTRTLSTSLASGGVLQLIVKGALPLVSRIKTVVCTYYSLQQPRAIQRALVVEQAVSARRLLPCVSWHGACAGLFQAGIVNLQIRCGKPVSAPRHLVCKPSMIAVIVHHRLWGFVRRQYADCSYGLRSSNTSITEGPGAPFRRA